MTISYQFINSVMVCWSIMSRVKLLYSMYFVSSVGMFEYMFVMSNDANADVGVSGVCFSS